MSKDAPTFHELPDCMKILVVDDEPDKLEKNIDSIYKALSADVSQLDVFSARNGINVIEAASTHKPQIVVLDNLYEENSMIWALKDSEIEALAKKFGINFEAIKSNQSGGMTNDLYFPNSTHFALLLRYFGFNGKIIVTSGWPPNPNEIEIERVALNEHLAKFDVAQINLPVINGVAIKNFESSNARWATTGEMEWDFHKIENAPYSQALNELITNIY